VNKLGSAPTTILASNPASNIFDSCSATHNGYCVYVYDGSLTGDLVLPTINVTGTRRVVVIVRNANVYITGTINVNNGNAFFGLFADRHIDIDESVGGAGQHLEGIYFAEGQINTCVADGVPPDCDQVLHFRGSVVGMGAGVGQGLDLNRDLGGLNSTNPGEVFEFGLDQVLMFPGFLGLQDITWREVAP
jgi:hypothetical protein